MVFWKDKIPVKKSRIFYGWWVIGACTIIYGFSALIAYTFTIYAPFILKEMNWTKTDYGSIYSAYLLIGIFWGLISGWLIDRFGSRKIIIIGVLITFTGLVLFSTMKTMTQAYIYFACIIGIGVTFQYSLPTSNLARFWFLKRAGTANGIMLSVFGITATIFFPLLTKMALEYGWRKTMLVSSILMLVVIFFLAFFIVRDNPEQMGLNIDGISDEEANRLKSAHKNLEEPYMIRYKAIRTPQFWILTFGGSLGVMIFGGFMGHITLIGNNVGLSAAKAATVMSAWTLPSVLGRLTGGLIADKFGYRRCFIIFASICGLLYLYAWYFAKTPLHLYVFVALFGLFSSPILVMIAPFIGDLFGRKHMGSIRGLHGLIQGLVIPLGAFIAGRIADIYGEYNKFYLFGVLANIIFIISVVFIKQTHVEKKLK